MTETITLKDLIKSHGHFCGWLVECAASLRMALQKDPRRAGIEPFARVINQSFTRAEIHDPLLAARGMSEVPFIREIFGDLSRRTALVAWVAEEPVGPGKLSQLLRGA
jgi:arsenite-transporting ATPase